ncbi:MAG: hypothetical protein AAF401_06145 [Pseudomonadota bacterium]
MKALTIAVTAVAVLSFATAASACPFMSKPKDTSAEAPILKPKKTS